MRTTIKQTAPSPPIQRPRTQRPRRTTARARITGLACALLTPFLAVSIAAPAHASSVGWSGQNASSSGSLGPGLGAPITQSTMIARAADWIAAGVPYSQSLGWSDAATGGAYRQDCSGFVSMAWALNSSQVTWTLPSVSTVIAGNIQGFTGLQPGDALDYTADHVLHRIVEQGPTTATELAQAEHVRRQSMAETLAGLRAGGLVADGKDPSDGRKVLVSATDEGRALVERSAATRKAWLSKAISGTLDAEERRVLLQAAEIMDRLADAQE